MSVFRDKCENRLYMAEEGDQPKNYLEKILA